MLFWVPTCSVLITDSKSGLTRRLIDGTFWSKARYSPVQKIMSQLEDERGSIVKHWANSTSPRARRITTITSPSGMMSKTNLIFNFLDFYQDELMMRTESRSSCIYEMYKEYPRHA